MWEIYAYQNSDSLFGIFNAVAGLMRTNGYSNSLALVVLVGFFCAFFAYAFAPQLLTGWKWLATVVLVSSVLVVPRVTVGIIDKTGGSAVKVVDNVPFGMAVLGSLTSTIGNTLTELFETVFQVLPGNAGLPSELTYQRHGLMFGSRLIRDTRTVSFQDPAARTDIIGFINNCTVFDLLDGTLSPAAFAKSDNVWPLMSTPNPARFTPITTAAGVLQTMTCIDAYDNLNQRLPAQISAIQGRLAFRLNPTLPAAMAQAAIAGQIEQAYARNQLASAAASAADIIRQNALINAINDSSQVAGQRVNDPASLILAMGRSQATAQTNAGWINGARMAEQALPIFRNVIESLTYAVYPIVVLLLFLTTGRETVLLARKFAYVLIWIQLWPPLYAVLNYVASVYSAMQLAAAADVGGGIKALAIQTAGSVYSTSVSGAAAAGSLVAAIPLIAWQLVRGMDSFGTAVMGSLGLLNTNVERSAAADASGNMSLGNVTMDQRTITPLTSNAGVTRRQAGNGDWLTMDGAGRLAVDKLANSGFASRTVSAKVSQQTVNEVSHAADAARSQAVSASQERSAALAQVLSSGRGWSSSTQSTRGNSTSSSEEAGQSVDRLNSITQQLAEKTGLSQSQVQKLAFELSVERGASFGKGAFAFGGEISSSADKTYSSSLTEDQQKLRSAMTQEQAGEFKRFADRASRDASFVKAVAADERQGSELASRVSTASSRAERAERNYAERVAIAERVSSAHEWGETITVDLSKSPNNAYLQQRYSQLADQYGEDSQAVQILLANELALQAQKPSGVFQDGAAVPASFDDVRGRFEQSTGDVQVNPQRVEATAQNNNAQIAQGGGAPMPVSGATPPAGTRQEVRDVESRLRQSNQSREGSFDQDHQITREADGSVHSKQSQALQNLKQLKHDVRNIVSGVNDAITGEGRKNDGDQ